MDMAIFSTFLKLFKHEVVELITDQPAEEVFSLEVEYLPAHHVVKLATRGPLTLEGNDQIVKAAINAGEQYQTMRFLVDDRKAKLEMSILNIYDLPKYNQQLGVRQDFRVALLFTRDGRNEELFRFYENRVVLNAFQQRVFSDEFEALAWLTADNPEK
jgi:hypothetical protein